MSVTVDFLFKASKDASFNNVVGQVTGGLGKLTDEAEEASKNIEELLSGDFKHANLTSLFADLTKAINSKDIDKINSSLVQTGKILNELHGKLNKEALKSIGELTAKQIDEVIESAQKKGAKKKTISDMVMKRIGETVSGKVAKAAKEDYSGYLKSEEEALQRIQELQKKDVLNSNNVKELKEYVGLYQRLVDLKSKKIPDIVEDEVKTIKKYNEDGIYRDANGKKLFNYQELMDGVHNAMNTVKEASSEAVESTKKIGETAKGTSDVLKELLHFNFDGSNESIKKFIGLLKEANVEAKNLAFHRGNLSDKSKPIGSETYNDMLSSLTENNFGSLGSGLYYNGSATVHSTKDDLKNFHGYLIDKSKYKLFYTRTNEMAEDLYTVLNLIEKISLSASGYRGFDVDIDGYNPKELFESYREVFEAIGLDYDSLVKFINEMQAEVAKTGIVTNESGKPVFKPIADLIAAKKESIAKYRDTKHIPEDVLSRANALKTKQSIPTQLMKMLGWEGIDNTGTNLDGFWHGSVIFDLKGTTPYLFRLEDATMMPKLAEAIFKNAGLDIMNKEDMDSFAAREAHINRVNDKSRMKYLNGLKTDPSTRIPTYHWLESNKGVANIEDIQKKVEQMANTVNAIGDVTDSFSKLAAGLQRKRTNISIGAIEEKANEIAETITAVDGITESFSELINRLPKKPIAGQTENLVEDTAQEVKRLTESITALVKSKIEMEKALSGSSVVVPTTIKEADRELGRRARNFSSWFKDPDRESKPTIGASMTVKYFKQLEAYKTFLTQNGLDPNMVKNSKFYIPQLDNIELAGGQMRVLSRAIGIVDKQIETMTQRLHQLNPEVKTLGEASREVAEEVETQAEAEDKAEKKSEDKLAKFLKRKQKEKEALKKQTPNESARLLADKQEEIRVNEELANSQENVAQTTANLTAEQQAQIKVLEEQKEEELEIIKVQEDWQKHIAPTLDDERYKTKGKKEATEQLRNATRHLASVRRNPEDYRGSVYEEELASIRWWKSWKEAQSKGVAERTLTQNRTDLANGHTVNRYIDEMQKELEFHLNVLAESKNKVAQIEQQIQDIVNGKTAGTTELPQEPEIRTTFSNLVEQARIQINQIMNQEIQTMTSEFMESGLRTQGQGQFTQLIEQARTQIDEVMNNATQEYMNELANRVLNSRLALPEMSSETARKLDLEKSNKEAWDKSIEEYNREMEQFYEKQAEETQKQAQAVREAQIKAIENGYKKFTSSKQTTYLSNMAKSVRTEQQNRQVAEHENQWNQLEEQYNIAKEAFKDDADALKRIKAARDEAIRIGEEALKAVNETAQQKAEQAAQKAEEQAQKAEESAEKQRQRAYNRSTKTIAKKEIREAQKYADTAQGYIDEGKILDTDKGAEFVQQIAAIKETINSIGNIDLINNDDTEQIEMAAEKAHQLADALEKAKAAGKDVIDVSGTEKALDMQQKIGQLMQNNNLSNEQFLKLSNYQEMLEKGGVNAKQLDDIAKGYSDINSEVSKGSTLIDAIQGKFKNLVGYMASFMSFYMMIRKAKEVANTVREFDDALTEMRKVSDESVETLKAYQKESYDMAASVGTDALSLQKSTADWMRLGESLEEAKKSATASNILLNVSEFDNIDQATTSLVAMSSAYKDLDKMEIIDKLNKIGKIELPKHMVTYGMVA